MYPQQYAFYTGVFSYFKGTTGRWISNPIRIILYSIILLNHVNWAGYPKANYSTYAPKNKFYDSDTVIFNFLRSPRADSDKHFNLETFSRGIFL